MPSSIANANAIIRNFVILESFPDIHPVTGRGLESRPHQYRNPSRLAPHLSSSHLPNRIRSRWTVTTGWLARSTPTPTTNGTGTPVHTWRAPRRREGSAHVGRAWRFARSSAASRGPGRPGAPRRPRSDAKRRPRVTCCASSARAFGYAGRDADGQRPRCHDDATDATDGPPSDASWRGAPTRR